MKYVVGALLACSILMNLAFLHGYKKYTISVRDVEDDSRSQAYTFMSFGDPVLITEMKALSDSAIGIPVYIFINHSEYAEITK